MNRVFIYCGDITLMRKEENKLKIIFKNNVKQALKELRTRALACEPHTMCPKCLKGRG